MILKETPWEKKNLGVNRSVEFYFDSTDTDETVTNEILQNTKYSYQVAHLPVGNIKLLNLLLSNGFSFIETKFMLGADLKNISLPNKYKTFMDSFGYHPSTNIEFNLICQKMREGIFDTDKISLDPYFDSYIAGNRYALWSQDEIVRGGCYCYIITNKSEAIGFFMLKKISDKIVSSFLGALFDKETYSGFGFLGGYYHLLEAKRLGFKRIETGVSSNNPDSLKMHLFLGYHVKSMLYTLIKHI